ncbi:arrestin domain-containing protein 2 [Nematolebias whitei]|uniref:arrestin domain-containing protein 2 n=1 Tax=Nematolebias whitei TaxID=451745 RepID=UPI0018992CD5|nr:arrestin domain-containing protein 2 [Nematolebias whitei]
MSPIENLTITCDKEDAYSEGDTITGVLSFNLTKDTKVKSVSVKAKGEAYCSWTEGSGDDERSYSAYRSYFKEKHFVVPEDATGSVLPKGIHHFKFRLTIPSESMPSSFKGLHGHIRYILQAKISRKWRWSSTATKEIDFASKSILKFSGTGCPQSGSVNKKVGVFSKGEVHLTASVNRDMCSPGDTLTAFAKICNTSSKSMKPKFSVLKKISYHAGGSTNFSHETLFKCVGDTIEPNSEATSSCNVVIPASAIYNINNCEIISVDYVLKVYLDISFRIDPVVVIPLTIAPPSLTYPCEEVGPYPSGAFGVPSYSDFPAPLYPNLVPTGVLNPAPQQANLASGSNELPPSAPLYDFLAPAYPSPSVQQPATRLDNQPEDQPPSYSSLF